MIVPIRTEAPCRSAGRGGASGARLEQVEREVLAVLREQPRTWPTNTGTTISVRSSTRSFAGSHRASVPLPCTTGRGLEARDGGPGHRGRARPARIRVRRRDHVLGPGVQRPLDGLRAGEAGLRQRAPRGGEQVAGPPSEQERVGALVGLVDERPGPGVPLPRARPPRSNPVRRSSSDAPPLPCTTPSRVVWTTVVSFMVAAPPARCRLSRGRPHSCYERHDPDPTGPAEVFSRTFPRYPSTRPDRSKIVGARR